MSSVWSYFTSIFSTSVEPVNAQDTQDTVNTESIEGTENNEDTVNTEATVNTEGTVNTSNTEEELPGLEYRAKFKLTKKQYLETFVIVKGDNNGCFATEPINQGYYTKYYGEYVDEYPENRKYTWEIYDYDENTLEPKYEYVMMYLDAMNVDSWSKYIRHADTEAESNITYQQYADKMYYFTTKNIKAGDELLIWCSEEYRDTYATINA